MARYSRRRSTARRGTRSYAGAARGRSTRRAVSRRRVSRRPSRARSASQRGMKLQIEVVSPSQVQRPDLSPIAATEAKPRERMF